MAIQAQTIISRASRTLSDPNAVAWSGTELLDYLNAGQRAVCHVNRDAYTKVGDVTLTAGVIQTLPADGLVVVRALYNTGSGRAIRHVGFDALNTSLSTWASSTQATDVLEYAADSREWKTFFVNPPNNGTGVIKMMYGAIPPVLTSQAQNIVLPDTYDTALWAYVCAMAYAKNTRRQDLQKSTGMMQMFMTLVTAGTTATKASMPDLKQIEQHQA
jgi:hypothetical protein